MNKNLLGIVVVLLLIAVGGYLVITRDVSEPTQERDGWTTYRNEELGFQFSYPEEWGEIIVQDLADQTFSNTGSRKYEFSGQAKYLEFSNNPHLRVQAKSKDYNLTGFGGDSPFLTDGFSNYEDEAQKIQSKSGYKIIERGDNYLTYIFVDGTFILVKLHSIVSYENDVFSGVEFTYGVAIEPGTNFDSVATDIVELRSRIGEDNIDDLSEVVRSLQAL